MEGIVRHPNQPLLLCMRSKIRFQELAAGAKHKFEGLVATAPTGERPSEVFKLELWNEAALGAHDLLTEGSLILADMREAYTQTMKADMFDATEVSVGVVRKIKLKVSTVVPSPPRPRHHPPPRCVADLIRYIQLQFI